VSKLKIKCDNKSGGSKSNYHVDGFAAFYVTAFEFSGDKQGTPGASAKAECAAESTNGKFCLFGMFLDGYVDGTALIDPSGTDYGAQTIQPLG